MTRPHPYTDAWCMTCGNPDGRCVGITAESINLHRVVPDLMLDLVARDIGVRHEYGSTLADIIRAEAGIGYGGHLNETGDDEDAILSAVALDEVELAGIHAARFQYTRLVETAIDTVAWPPSTSGGSDA